MINFLLLVFRWVDATISMNILTILSKKFISNIVLLLDTLELFREVNLIPQPSFNPPPQLSIPSNPLGLQECFFG